MPAKRPRRHELDDAARARQKLARLRGEGRHDPPASTHAHDDDAAQDPLGHAAAVRDDRVDDPAATDPEREDVEAPRHRARDANLHRDADADPHADARSAAASRRQQHERRMVAGSRAARGPRRHDDEGGAAAGRDHRPRGPHTE